MRLKDDRYYGDFESFGQSQPGEFEEKPSPGGAAPLDRVRPLDCLLTERDRAALEGHLDRLGGYGEGIYPQLLRYLDAKLADALRVRDDEIPRGLATGNSRIVYALPHGGEESRILVHSTNDFVVGFSLPTATLLGAALLGAMAGQRVPYLTAEGELRHAEIRAVPFQPEAAREEAGE